MAHEALAALARGLADLERSGLRRVRRVLDSAQGPVVQEGGRTLVNFGSNDYLGLADHPRIKAVAHAAIDSHGVGSGASALVVGHSRLHEDAEANFARFIGLPRALLFPSGYCANLGILTALAGRSTEIFADRLNHACLNDGALLARAKFTRYPHGDLDRLEALLSKSAARDRIIATDAVFSMDGDIARVDRLVALAEVHDAWLVLDDAHGIGVLGEGGRGTPAHFGVRSPRIVYMATLGKALGGHGAFVAGEPEVVDWLMQRARTYVFSTAPAPAMAAAASEALRMLEEDPSMTRRLHDRVATFRTCCAQAGIASASTTAIQPILVGNPARAVVMSHQLRDRGFLVPAIRPPTVPDGTARLRISISAAHSTAQVEALVRALNTAIKHAPSR